MSMEPFVAAGAFARWIPPFGMFNWMQSGRCFCGCQKDFSGAFFNVKNTRRRSRVRNRKGFYLKIFLGTDRFHLLFLVFYGIIRADNEKLSKNNAWRETMKCVKSQTGVIKRVSNEVAIFLTSKGWSFISKAEWKLAGRPR